RAVRRAVADRPRPDALAAARTRPAAGRRLSITESKGMPYHSIFRPGLFDGQIIVVTGGGSGIGRCTAHELKSLGTRLALVGRTQAKLDQVKEGLGGPHTLT